MVPISIGETYLKIVFRSMFQKWNIRHNSRIRKHFELKFTSALELLVLSTMNKKKFKNFHVLTIFAHLQGIMCFLENSQPTYTPTHSNSVCLHNFGCLTI